MEYGEEWRSIENLGEFEGVWMVGEFLVVWGVGSNMGGIWRKCGVGVEKCGGVKCGGRCGEMCWV